MDDNKDMKHASFFQKNIATLIDVLIVILLRATVAQILWSAFLQDSMANFSKDFYDYFGETVKRSNPDHLAYISQSSFFKFSLFSIVLVALVGMLYTTIFHYSSWSATIGKRVCSLMLIDNNNNKITFAKSFMHYIISIVPWIIMIYLTLYLVTNQGSFYDLLIGNTTNLALSIISVIWLEVQIITKKKIGVQDILCSTSIVIGKSDDKFPKFK